MIKNSLWSKGLIYFCYCIPDIVASMIQHVLFTAILQRNGSVMAEEIHQEGKRLCLLQSGQSLGRIAQSVTCLAADACLTADPGVASSIPVWSHTFVEIDHEMISTVILPLPLIHSGRVVVSYKRQYVHELLVNRLFKPAQEKVWLGELTVPQ